MLFQSIQRSSWSLTDGCQPLKNYLSHYKVPLGTEEVITAIPKVISAVTKMILATSNPMSAPKKLIVVTTKVILTTKEAITGT